MSAALRAGPEGQGLRRFRWNHATGFPYAPVVLVPDWRGNSPSIFLPRWVNRRLGGGPLRRTGCSELR